MPVLLLTAAVGVRPLAPVLLVTPSVQVVSPRIAPNGSTPAVWPLTASDSRPARVASPTPSAAFALEPTNVLKELVLVLSMALHAPDTFSDLPHNALAFLHPRLRPAADLPPRVRRAPPPAVALPLPLPVVDPLAVVAQVPLAVDALLQQAADLLAYLVLPAELLLAYLVLPAEDLLVEDLLVEEDLREAQLVSSILEAQLLPSLFLPSWLVLLLVPRGPGIEFFNLEIKKKKKNHLN